MAFDLDLIYSTPRRGDRLMIKHGWWTTVSIVWGESRIVKSPTPDPDFEGMVPSPDREIEREARIYERLGIHPNILRYYGRTEDGGILLESALYRSIFSHWMGYELCPMHIRLKWCLQVAEALAWCHSHGIIHGHLEPDDIFLTEDLDAKLADFGGSSIDGSCFLSWAYPPFNRWPRLWDSDGLALLDETDDIFGFGTLVLSIFSARYPYSDIPRDECMRRCNATPPDLPPIPTNVDPRIRDIIKKCWDGDYVKADQLVDVLKLVYSERFIDPLEGDVESDLKDDYKAAPRQRRDCYCMYMGNVVEIVGGKELNDGILHDGKRD